jgi:lysophospholipase L1-like esterase
VIVLHSYPVILFVVFLVYVLICRYKNKFPHANNFSQKNNHIRVACVGDSITQGDGTKFQPFLAYPSILQRELTRTHAVRNFGKNAATATQGLPESYIDHPFYAQVCNSRADIIVCMLGTNDSKVDVWQGTKKFISDYTAMLKSFAAMPSHPRIILLFPPKAYKPDFWEHCFYTIQDDILQNELIPAIRTIADNLKLETIDIYNLTDNHRTWFIYDGIHPNPLGTRAIATAVRKKITESKL